MSTLPSISSTYRDSITDATVVNISGRPFRLSSVPVDVVATPAHSQQQCQTSTSSIALNISTDCSSGISSYSIPVPHELKHNFLKTQKKIVSSLEQDHGVTIKSTYQSITITSQDASSIHTTASLLTDHLQTHKLNAPPTHFLAVPLVTQTDMRDTVTSISDRIIELLIDDPQFKEVQLVGYKKFHLTLLVLNAYDDGDVDEVNKILDENAEQILNILGRDLALSLSCLSIMKGSPEKCKVLHFDVINDDNLQRIFEFRRFIMDKLDKFISPRIKKQSFRAHATILNTKYGAKGRFNVKVNVSNVLQEGLCIQDPIAIPCICFYKMDKDPIFGYPIENVVPLNSKSKDEIIDEIREVCQ
ncbi:hypothetical protein P9112_007937 [Eukaryota sp. TZLM1-RC]